MCRTTSRMTSWSRGSTRPRSTTRRTSPSRRARISPRSRSTPIPGISTIVNFTASDDFGRIINPMIVAGQVHGGLAQGIGQALLEGCVYDKETGQLLTGSYNDYAMPRADDLPSFELSTNVTLCTHNPLGVKGCGEAGAIGAPAAITNAIVDALKALGVRHVEMPATPERLWRMIQQHRPAARRGIGRGPMYEFNYHKPGEPRRRRRSCSARRGRQAGRRRHDPDPDPEAASREAVRPGRPRRDPVAAGHHARKATRSSIGAMTRHAEVNRSPVVKRGDPGPRRARRHDRRPGGAQPRHDRRLDRQQRPGGGLSRRRVVALDATVRTTKREIAGRRFLHRHVRDRARPGRDRHRGASSRSRRPPPTRNSGTRPRATRSSACSSPAPPAACASR